MKKGVLNYSITWNQDGQKREELCFNKKDTVYRYLDILFSDMDDRLTGKGSHISSLRILEIYTNPTKQPEDITGKVNKFLS